MAEKSRSWKIQRRRTRWWGRRRWIIWDPKEQQWIDGDFRHEFPARNHAYFLIRFDQMTEQAG